MYNVAKEFTAKEILHVRQHSQLTIYCQQASGASPKENAAVSSGQQCTANYFPWLLVTFCTIPVVNAIPKKLT